MINDGNETITNYYSCRPLVERQELRSQRPQAPQESQPGEPNNSDVGTNLAVVFENYYLNTSLKKLYNVIIFPESRCCFHPNIPSQAAFIFVIR